MRNIRTDLRLLLEDLPRTQLSDGDINEGCQLVVPDKTINELKKILADLQHSAQALPAETAVLQRLYYDSMHAREDAVEHAEIATYEWMFGIAVPKEATTSKISRGRSQTISDLYYALAGCATSRHRISRPPSLRSCLSEESLATSISGLSTPRDDQPLKVAVDFTFGLQDGIKPKHTRTPSPPPQLRRADWDDDVFHFPNLLPNLSPLFLNDFSHFLQNNSRGPRYEVTSFFADGNRDNRLRWSLLQRFLHLTELPSSRYYHEPEETAGSTSYCNAFAANARGDFDIWDDDNLFGDLFENEQEVAGRRVEESSQHPAAGSHDAVPGVDSVLGPKGTDVLRRLTAQRFKNFLQGDHGVFFICGKAGCGKSNFMKFLAYHPDVRTALTLWAGNKKLVLVPFYFWKSGQNLQMSLEGLYRTILFEILRSCAELFSTVFPNETNPAVTQSSVSEQLRLPGLRAAIDRLTQTRKLEKHRICLFIDGLDEFEGESPDYLKLARDLRSWADTEDLKVVCSARPYHEFLDVFTEPERTMSLHELNKDDIRQFLMATLRKGLDQSDAHQPLSRYSHLVNEIVERCEGVFLWARLVIRSIITGIIHQDSLEALWKRLDSMPRDLQSVYSKMLEEADESARNRTEMMLQLALHVPWGQRLTALEYSWLEELEKPDFPFYLPFEPYSTQEIERRHQYVRRQLVLLTKGLLEMRKISVGNPMDIHAQYTVEFFHRTARDFVQDNMAADGQNRQCGSLTVDSNLIFRIWIARMKTFPLQSRIQGFLEPIRWICSNPHYQIPSGLLDELADVIKHRYGFSSSATLSLSSAERLDVPQESATPSPSSLLSWRPWSMEIHVSPNQDPHYWSASRWIAHLNDLNDSCTAEASSQAAPILFNLYPALLYLQHDYLLNKLRKDASSQVQTAHIARYLLAVLISPSPKVHFARYALESGVRPHNLLTIKSAENCGQIMNDGTRTVPKSIPLWSLLLRIFAEDVRYYLKKDVSDGAEERLAKLLEILELFALHGAEPDVLFVCHKDKLEKLSYSDTYMVNEDAVFHAPLEQLISATSASAARSLIDLLARKRKQKSFWRWMGGDPHRRLWSQASSGLKKLTKNTYRPIADGALEEGGWVIWGVFTKDYELVGDFAYELM